MKIKNIIRGVLKLIAVLILAFVIFLVGVVVIIAESPEEFVTYRMDNAVEYFLNREDGITIKEMGKSVYAAYVSTIEARSIYPDDPMHEDAYKHYTWNYESTKLIGEEKTKLITDNHEVALTIREAVKNFYYCQLEKFKCEEGVLRYIARPRAFVLTARAIPQIRKTVVDESKKVSTLEIENYYSKATIMDFYNNEMGRRDSLIGKGEGARNDAFLLALNEGRIVEDYAFIEPQYYDFTLDYVTKTIDYWVSWFLKRAPMAPFSFPLMLVQMKYWF